MDGQQLWQRYRAYRYDAPDFPFSLDVSRVSFDDSFLARVTPAMTRAIEAMECLEAGAIANTDEHRMVGHYWLRAPDVAPTKEIGDHIRAAVASVQSFAHDVRTCAIQGADGPFRHLVHVAIGGSTIGTQFLCSALRRHADPITVHFLDNADPDALDDLLATLDGALGQTFVSAVSKSGWTPTPQIMLQQMEKAYRHAGLDFARHAVATTMDDTELALRAKEERWLARFPLWDWVGGKNSVLSAVGLLPTAIQGSDIRALLNGAATMDRLTRERKITDNPAALLAAMWHWLGEGGGKRDMVLLPYRDRLSLFPRYAQMLVMESVGKELDRSGAIVHQGLTVFGHKGATDQHTYVQQLRDGPADFFVVFIFVRNERNVAAREVSPGLTVGDYLYGNLDGTRDALYKRGRDSLTISVPDVSPFSVGLLIGLFERTVGLYSELLDLNAYYQPGVEKAVAATTVELQQAAVACLAKSAQALTAEEVAQAIGRSDRTATVFEILERLATDPSRSVSCIPASVTPDARFHVKAGR